MPGTELATQRSSPPSSMAKSAGFPSPNSVSSSRFVPMTRSTPEAAPAATASRGSIGRNVPSTVGRKGRGTRPGSGRLLPSSAVAATSSVAAMSSNDAWSHDATPNIEARRSPARSASSTVCTCTPPLCTMARRKRPRAAGQPSSAATLKPPADSPKMVTLSGSPPKAAMFSCTQSQRGNLVLHAPIADQAVRIGELPVPEEAQRTQSVVDRDHDGVAVADQVAASVEEHRAAPRREAAAVDEHHDRPAALRVEVRRPDIEEQAVLALRFRCVGIGRARDPGNGGRLRRDGPERRRVPDRVPRLCGQRWAPAERTDRGTRVRHTRERPQVAAPDTPQPPLSCVDDPLHAS